jgi:glutamate synthase (NADPH/NADH) small chain
LSGWQNFPGSEVCHRIVITSSQGLSSSSGRFLLTGFSLCDDPLIGGFTNHIASLPGLWNFTSASYWLFRRIMMADQIRIEAWERDLDRKARLRIPASRLDYRPADDRVQDFEEACLGFSLLTAQEEASRCVECPEPQGCVLACPLHNDIPTAMWEIHKGNILAAAEIYRQTSNFPELCGRLCPDECLCAGSCGVGKFHPDIRLGRLEAFVADYQREASGGIPVPTLQAPSGKRVAVVGSGPAGLTIAEELSRLGHKVTVFEKRRRAGGTLIYDIPRFRLPLDIVEDKVAQLQRMGVEFIYGTRVGSDPTLDDLFNQGYDAIFLGTGAGIEERIEIPGRDLDGTYQATEYLRYTNLPEVSDPGNKKRPHLLGKQVVVVGGGYAAVDCARTAIRMGAQDVTCFYRCELDKLCRVEDKIAAQEEGVDFVPLTEVAELVGDITGHVVQALCQHMRPSGIGLNAIPVPVEGAIFKVDADLVIFAPERSPESLVDDSITVLETGAEGWLRVDQGTGQTSRQGVYAAGDNTGQTQLAVLAIAEARKVASAMHDYLKA